MYGIEYTKQVAWPHAIHAECRTDRLLTKLPAGWCSTREQHGDSAEVLLTEKS